MATSRNDVLEIGDPAWTLTQYRVACIARDELTRLVEEGVIDFVLGDDGMPVVVRGGKDEE